MLSPIRRGIRILIIKEFLFVDADLGLFIMSS